MFAKTISAILIAVLVHGSVAAQEQLQPSQQSVASMQKVLRKAEQKHKSVNVTLIRKVRDRRKLSGLVSDISGMGFVLTDEKTGVAETLAFTEVREVSQKGLSTTVQIVFAAGIVTIAAMLIYFALRPKT